MNKNVWKNQVWIMEQPYPEGIKPRVYLLVILSTLLLVLIFWYHYPVYETFYGMIQESKKNIVTVMVPFSKMKEFEHAIVKNKDMKLVSVDSESQVISGEKVMKAEVTVSISKKLLVENNIVTIRVKTKDMSIWKEVSQKWKKGMKNETNRN